MVKMPKKAPFALVGDTPALGCSSCFFYDKCGGLLVREPIWDCFETCRDGCVPSQCDYVCPHKPDFADRILEAGGLRPASQVRLLPLEGRLLPLYIPQIIHGKKRRQILSNRLVALPTFRVLTGGENTYGESVKSGSALREQFRLHPATEVLLVSVAPDGHLERYWRCRRLSHAPARLAQLGILGMTLPNYSIFLNVPLLNQSARPAPRTHWLFNRARMLRVGEELAQAGVSSVPHLNASSTTDWQYWERLLIEHPRMRYVSKEFQTGLTRLNVGRDAIDALARLQDRVGRDLHPIVVGGTRFLEDFARKFQRFTLVDSVPFMATIHRRRLVPRGQTRIGRVPNPTPADQPLDDLLEENIHQYETWLYERARLRDSPMQISAESPAAAELAQEAELVIVGKSPAAAGELLLT